VKRKPWILLAAVGFASGLSACWGFGSRMVRSTPDAVAAARAPARDLRIESKDGLSLAATYWPGRTPTSPAVLLLHGNRSSRAAMAGNAAWLAGHGYAVLTIDFRGCGESAEAPHSFGWFESRDAEAAFDWLKRRQHGAPVAVIGASLGGAAALLGERGPLPADAMVLQAVYPDIRSAIRNRIAAESGVAPAYLLEPLLSFQSRPRFGVWPSQLSPLESLRHYRGPVLVIGGGKDQSTPPVETKAVFAAAPGPKSLWIEPGVGHSAATVLRSDSHRRRLLDFLRAHIGASSPARVKQTGGRRRTAPPSPASTYRRPDRR
jgi:pimeloyl-ACP methyl ester carboxylesterase